VQAGPSTSLTIDQPNIGQGGGLEVGAHVVVSWPATQCSVLADG
jgi:hypothetical protein